MKGTHLMNKIEQGVHIWENYWGALLEDGDPEFPSIIYGFENCSSENSQQTQAVIPEKGACYGFLAQGSAIVNDTNVNWQLNAGQWFSLKNGCKIDLKPQSRLVVSQRIGFNGVYAMGGPIEDKGRLRYIDGCSDTLLCPPLLLGNPCLNLLHFPPQIDQTAHTHPSTRAGMVARGQGVCVTENKAIPLTKGLLFYIARNTLHKFRTTENIMDVIAYHPDSDWGPTHEQHPMVNRTWVDGTKINNNAEQHLKADIVEG